MASILRDLPTKLADTDLLGFAPLEVVTVADLRRGRVRNVKSLAALTAAAVAGFALYRGYVEAKGHLDDLDAAANGG